MSAVPSSPLPSCPICLHPLSEPVSLPCGHSFCLTCLQTMSQGLDRHSCPDCHQEYRPQYFHHSPQTCPEYYHIQYYHTEYPRADDTGIIANNTGLCGGKLRTKQDINEDMREEISGGFQNKTELLKVSAQDNQRSDPVKVRDMAKEELEEKRSGEFPNKIALSIADDKHQKRSNHQNLSAAEGGMEEEGLEGEESGGYEDKTAAMPENVSNNQQNITAVGRDSEEKGLEQEVFQNITPISEEDRKLISESKSKLASHVTQLTTDLEKAEISMNKEQQYESKVMVANAKIRENALNLVEEIIGFAQSYSEQIMKQIENELGPGELIIHNRVTKASQLTSQIKKTKQEAESMLNEPDERLFLSKIENLQSQIEKCKEQKQDQITEVKFNLAKVCPELDQLSTEFRDRFGQIQRLLRNTFNPSEVTFDPETVHPNLVLSDDLKTVKFSAKKQQYAESAKRFSSFYQVLSTQSFLEGVHSWEVQLEGAPWMLGVCGASLPRTGLPSALESSRTSWSLMWSSNLLTAFDCSQDVRLQKKTSRGSRRVRVTLDCEQHLLDFHDMSPDGGTNLIHRFRVELNEPLHLGYRLLSGEARGGATICT